MKSYLFARTHTCWEGYTMIISGVAMGLGHVWVSVGVLLVGAVIEGVVEGFSR